MSAFDVFTKDLVRNTIPRLPADSPLRLYTGATGDTLVQNDDGSNPFIFTLRDVGELALLEDVSITAETYRATLIVETEPSTNDPWWFSTDGGTTKERVKVLKKELGTMGHFYSIYFQVQN